MRKMLLFLLAMGICLISFAGCAPAGAPPADGAAATTPPPAAPALTPAQPAFHLTAQIGEQAIYEGDGLVVKAASLEEKDLITKKTVLGETQEKSELYAILNIAIENGSSRCVTVKAYAMAVNGITVNAYQAAPWADAGRSGTASFALATEKEFNLAGITDVARIDFMLHIEDADSWEVIADTPVTLTTSIAGSYPQDAAPPQGDVVYDENGVKIMTLGRDEEGLYSFFGPGLLLYVENNTDQSIWITTKYDASFNGASLEAEDYETWGFLSTDYLMPGTCAYTSLAIEDRFLKKMNLASVGDIDRIECAFVINKMDSYGEILFKTPRMTMTLD